MTQQQLARRARTSQSAIARWESGQVVPSFERLRELVRACGLELTFGLATYDDSYDEWITKYLELTPRERLERSEAREREYAEFRRAAEAALG
jgi:transcriptional regulator with XRE-family HTH domain